VTNVACGQAMSSTTSEAVAYDALVGEGVRWGMLTDCWLPSFRNFAEQVAAMETRAKQIGLGPQLRYLWPQGPGDSPGRSDFAPDANDSKAINALGLGNRILADIHGPAMGGVSKAEQVFAEAATKSWGAMNLETNCGDHTFHRALTEGRDLNLFHSFPNAALAGRAASFCMERSGYNEGFANDQGLSFYLPNGTFLQPAGYVHAMFASSWQPFAVNFSLSGSSCAALNVTAGDISVVASEVGPHGTHITARVVNAGSTSVDLRLTTPDQKVAAVESSTLKGSACAVDAFPYGSEHRSPCSNTPANPTLFAPNRPASVPEGQAVHVPAYSFNTIVATVQ
jgi:hypothetical protein